MHEQKKSLKQREQFDGYINDNPQYRPLPDSVTIKESGIHGLGLFATDRILQGTNLGMIHYTSKEGNIMRTPLGGFGNHSETPNCKKLKDVTDGMVGVHIITTRDIAPGEEITWRYTLYKIGDSHDKLREGRAKKKGIGMEFDRFKCGEDSSVAPI